jgi:hypothetical protein
VEGDDRGEAYTTIVWGVGLSHEMAISQGPRRSMVSKATCAAPSCEALSPCRGLRPHHARRDRVGTWETSSGPQSLWRFRAAAGRRGAEAAVEQARSRTSLVVPVKRPNKAARSGGGGRGGKGARSEGWQTTGDAPGTGPDQARRARRLPADRRCRGRVRTLVWSRPTSGRSWCGKAARRDLCGGQGEIPAPTATAKTPGPDRA